VAGLGHRQGDLNRVDVAHLADEEDIGVLAEGGSQSSVERRAVQADFALVDGGRFVIVNVFDGSSIVRM